MQRCVVCGNDYDKAFRVTFADGASHVFDSFECAIQALAPRCQHCGCRMIGHGIERAGVMFCCEHCAREAAGDAVDRASEQSFPASDPPAFGPAARAGGAPVTRRLRSRRREEGRVGWVLLWLLGVPLPLLALLYFVRGCT